MQFLLERGADVNAKVEFVTEGIIDALEDACKIRLKMNTDRYQKF